MVYIQSSVYTFNGIHKLGAPEILRLYVSGNVIKITDRVIKPIMQSQIF